MQKLDIAPGVRQYLRDLSGADNQEAIESLRRIQGNPSIGEELEPEILEALGLRAGTRAYGRNFKPKKRVLIFFRCEEDVIRILRVIVAT